jgi:hypothetical protein
MKYTAFTLCLTEKYPQCRAEFVKIYDVNPRFDLTPAEAGIRRGRGPSHRRRRRR